MTPVEREAIKRLAGAVKVLAEIVAATHPKCAEVCARIEQDMDDIVLSHESRRTMNLECGVTAPVEDDADLPPVGWYQ